MVLDAEKSVNTFKLTFEFPQTGEVYTSVLYITRCVSGALQGKTDTEHSIKVSLLKERQLL